jgi:hypothetical protein
LSISPVGILGPVSLPVTGSNCIASITVRLGSICDAQLVNMRCTIWGQIHRNPQSISSLILWLKEPFSDWTTPSTLEIPSCIVARGLIFLPQNFAQLILDSSVHCHFASRAQ